MNNKERMHACLEGRAVDRNPVTVFYSPLYYHDHFEELTGEPQWRMTAWRYAEMAEHLRLYRVMVEKAPFEMLQPDYDIRRSEREQAEFITRGGKHTLRNKTTGALTALDFESGHADEYTANEDRKVRTIDEIAEKVAVIPPEEQIAEGLTDKLRAVAAEYGKDQFILSGGVVGTIYSAGWHVGQTNALAMLRLEPEFMDALCQRICEQNIATIQAYGAAGGDAIYIDDATATNDMISPADYERYSLPYMRAMVDEIHRLKHKAIVIYFGGISDRLEQIAATGADCLLMEASMKGFRNEIDAVVEKIGERMTLCANIDPLAVLEQADEAGLTAEMTRQAEAGRKGRGFIMSTGSPITPRTPLSRVRRFIELGKTIR